MRGLWIDHRKPYRPVWNELGIAIHLLAAGVLGLFALISYVGFHTTYWGDGVLPARPSEAGPILGSALICAGMAVWAMLLAIQLIRRQMRRKGPL